MPFIIWATAWHNNSAISAGDDRFRFLLSVVGATEQQKQQNKQEQQQQKGDKQQQQDADSESQSDNSSESQSDTDAASQQQDGEQAQPDDAEPDQQPQQPQTGGSAAEPMPDTDTTETEQQQQAIHEAWPNATEEEQQQLDNLLRKVQDDPALLLRNKMYLEYLKRQQQRLPTGVDEQW